jgi:phosphopantetheinyl transferase/acyl carrier protein
MIDLNLDLEAELGIDSIKRVEILGTYQQETGIHLGEQMEELAARKTLKGVMEFLASAEGAPEAQEELAPIALDTEGVGQLLLRLVSEKTGYPAEMIDLDLDLEADLGIDSIKRVEILGAYQQETGIHLGEKMEELAARKTLLATIEFLVGTDEGGTISSDTSPAAGGHPDPSPNGHTSHGGADLFPFVQEVVSLAPGEVLEARCVIDLDRYPFLRDHTLGRDVSTTDPELAALAIVPMTMSMEMMAEAAAILVPDQRLIGMREVRANRWIALEEGPVALKLVARCQSPKGEVHVQIRKAEAADAPSPVAAMPLAEGIMVFAEAYPEPPTAGALPLTEPEPSKWPSERLYEEAMFHGPAFRGVRSMDQVGAGGAEATLIVLPLEGLFDADAGHRDGSGPAEALTHAPPTLLTDPILLDQPGQVVGFWTAQLLEEAHTIFPFRFEALHLFGPLLPPYERVKCQAQIALVGDRQVRSDLDVVRADGRVWARFVGWEDLRFDVPWTVSRFALSPRDVVISQPWSTPEDMLSGPEGVRAYRLDLESFPSGYFTAHDGIWRRVLANLVLSRREREVWHGLRTPEPRRLEWLLGRVVAKDAVRQHLKQRYGLVLCPADVEILPDDKGRPVVGGTWTDRIPSLPVVSVSHAAGTAVAVVADGEVGLGVGVDIEHVGRMNQDVEALAFVPEERELLSSLRDVEEDEWPLRFWCAKEAVAKAVGQGLIEGPQSVIVKALDTHNGTVQISLAGKLARRVRDVDGSMRRRVRDSGGTPRQRSALGAVTAREGDLILAIALYKPNRRVDENEE